MTLKKYDNNLSIDCLKITFECLPIQEIEIFDEKKYILKFSKEFINYDEEIRDKNTGFYHFDNGIKLKQNPRKDNKSKAYYNSYSVYHGNRMIGTFFTDGILNKEYCLFKFAPSYFQGIYKLSINHIINLIQSTFNLRLNNISQLDIALDTKYNILNVLIPIIDGCLNNPYFTALRKETTDIETIKKFKGRTLKNARYQSVIPSLSVSQPFESTIMIGKKQNGKQLICYDKSNKSRPYQKKYFQQRFGTTNVYRLELSLIRQNSNKKKFDENIDLSKLDDPKYLLDLFVNESHKMLTFNHLKTSYIDKKGNTKYKQTRILDLFNLSKSHMVSPMNVKLDKIEKIAKDTRKENANKRYVKQNVIKYLDTVLENNHGNTLLDEITDFIENKDIRRNATTGNIDSEDVHQNYEVLFKIINELIEKDYSLIDPTVHEDLIRQLERNYENKKRDSYSYIEAFQ